jgi:hypothetical protein
MGKVLVNNITGVKTCSISDIGSSTYKYRGTIVGNSDNKYVFKDIVVYYTNDKDTTGTKTYKAVTYNDTKTTFTAADITSAELPNYCHIYFEGSIVENKSYVEPSLKNNVENTTAEIEYNDTNANVTLKCSDGYSFDDTPTAVLTYDDNPFADEVEITLSIDSDNKVAQGSTPLTNLSETCTITFTGNTKSDSKPVPTFVNNIANTTWEYSYANGVYSIKVTCNTGYEFDGTPYVQYKNLETEYQSTINLTIDDTNTIGTCTLTTSVYTDLTATGSTKAQATPTKVTNNITGASYTGSVSGTIVSGTITAKTTTGCFVGVVATYVGADDGATHTATLLPDTTFGSTINVLLSNIQTGSEVVLSGAYRGVCKVTDNTTGCKSTGIQAYYVENDKVTITLVANTNTSFSTTDKPKIEFSDQLSVVTTTEFTLSDDNKTANVSWVLPSTGVDYTELYIYGTTTPDKVITGYGSINVYKVDTNALNQFAETRFKYKDTTETGLTPDGDLAEYVNRLHKVYCDVGETIGTTIKCGNNDTKISCESINNAVVSVSFGSVVLPTYNNNNTDLNNKIQVFLPFVGFVGVDSDLQGETLYLKYDIDLVTGEGVYTLQTDTYVIAQGVCDCSNEVLFRTSQTLNINTIGSDKYKSTYLLGLKPYVSVKYFSEMPNKTATTTQQVSIGGIIGFAKFDGVHVNFTCLAEEQTEIDNLLQQGVIL